MAVTASHPARAARTGPRPGTGYPRPVVIATVAAVTDQEWTAPDVERTEPERVAAERVALEQWLDFHRATLLLKCAGLTAEQLKRRSCPPSNLSLLGLLRHMTEVERWWFRMHAGGEDLTFPYDPDGAGLDFDDVDSADAGADLEAYRQEIEAARAAVDGKDLDLVVPSRGDHPERTRDVRWIFVHMIEEYARHNGHADLLREAIDGATGD
jgi:uncharacterized damage-inducible protein DinB